MNVFEMYVEHGKEPGFWLRRTTWGNTCAKVTSVGKLNGKPPYYGNPEVRADIFDLRTGELKESDAAIAVPGTYKTWRWIDPPEWSSDRPFDPHAGRVRLWVDFADNAEAKKLGARWSALLDAFWLPEADLAAIEKAKELGFLTPRPPPAPLAYYRVPFARKAAMKALGGSWDPAVRLWSLPSDNESALRAAAEQGFEQIEPEDAPDTPPRPGGW